MEKKNIGKIVLIAGVIILTGGLIYFIKSKKTLAADILPGTSPIDEQAKITKTPEGEIIITNFDSVWDYKFSDNKWYTRKKGSEVWLDMKEKLSPANYTSAIMKLASFVTKK